MTRKILTTVATVFCLGGALPAAADCLNGPGKCVTAGSGLISLNQSARFTKDDEGYFRKAGEARIEKASGVQFKTVRARKRVTNVNPSFKQAKARPPEFHPGDILPDDYYVLINTSRYGLPPVESGTMYFRVNRRAYLVDADSRQILEDVTHMTNRAF